VETTVNIFFLVLALVGWYFFSFRVLRYMVDASEGRWKWELAGYLILLCVCIFLGKFTMHSLTGFPSPGSWSSRLFLGFSLVASYLVPFAREYALHFFGNRRK
jgi:hypothetical protein